MRLAIPLLVLLSGAIGAEEPGNPLPVLFTGRLMGYFRVPDQQTSGSFECRDGVYPNSPQVDALERRLKRLAGEKPRLLVALGDNFSPDLLSRFIYLNGVPEAKDTLLVDADNVGCFLRLAGYDAVVPGKHDFYFGPERLREYARYLAQGAAHTTMLGANLAIVTTSAVATKKTQAPKNQVKLDLPDAVFPWMQNFTVQDAYEFQKDVTVNPAGGPKQALSDFSPQATIKDVDVAKHQLKILDNRAYSTIEIKWKLQGPCILASGGTAQADCAAAGARSLVMTEDGLRDRHPDGTAIASHPPRQGLRPVMLPPAEYCFLAGTTNGKTSSCRLFTVQWPFFDAFDTDTSKWAEPYLLKNVGGEMAAIFGVVDGGLKEHVGLLNYSWANGNPDLDTQLLVADPVAGLDQALQYCQAKPECRDARKILLAQMPYEQAQLLADTFRLLRTSPKARSQAFELVLAQTDNLHAAVNQTRSQDAVAPFVLSPGQIFEDNDESVLHVRVYRAELSRHFDAGRPKLDLALTSDQEIVSPEGSYKIDSGTMKLPNAMSRKQLQAAALGAMRERRNTDIALLQRRDLFELPDNAARQRVLSLQEQMDTVFWKGDFVVHIDVTGAQLKSVMDQSRQFDQWDGSALDSGLERGRGLLSLGIWQDDDTNWSVNGAAIDPNRLYSVAATDYLAFGDTGYTGLRPATLPRIGTFELVRLASLVCHRISATDPSCKLPVLAAGNYFDQTDATVLDPKPPATALDDLEKWIHVTSAKKPADDSEDRAQNRTYWSAALEKADVGYSFYHHDPASQVQLKSEFAGIPQTQVLTPNSIAISNDYRLRIVRSGRRWDRYLLAEESYEHDVKQANDDTRMDSQASNMIGFESGLNWRITPDGRRLPAVKMLASVRAETNPAQPLASFNLKPGGTLVRPIDRQTRFPAKIGTRIENRVSWLEFGYQIGRNVNSPLGYEFLDPVTRAVLATCGATAARQKSALATCIANVSDPTKTATPVTTTSDVTALTQNRWQQGLFLNFKLQVPLFRKGPYSVQYVMENAGNLYFHYFNQTDYSLDTRYLDAWTHSLVVKLVGNLNFAPKLQYLFYENMVDHLRMHSIATSVSLQYNFAWHSGMGWKNALSYADPTLKSAK
jgi:hypothetical protein